MKITRQRLREIILEEVDMMEAAIATDVKSDVTEDDADMGDISEGEGMEVLQQAAQTLIDAGILGAESPEELMMALRGLGKAALMPLAAVAMGGAAMAGKDAIDKIRSKDSLEEPSQALEEDSGDILTQLITQAIQEQLS
tara:strand:- start:1712 stop:2131 length:420 start_codon:yes stop_codon:yes gene_type:complete